ncbi:MATE family efflux transporter [Solitalea koreensis]|uniref:Multidrug-efflux transporter n=1 Tax=Solitalea koreensis TaxID=543615 RepID=A0A521BPN4_9SPHI|nr:MATE family efflux transporter [Solitalea koreensis]SMO49035.1 putative efflux protein, MATE family [Solitalea koreensis]
MTTITLPTKISFKEINRLAIPALLAGVIEPVISLTDLAIVGKIKFDTIEILAAVGIASSLIAAMTWILAQTSSAISAIVSQYYGAKKLDKVESLVAQTITFSLMMSIIITLLSRYYSVELFKLYNANGKILQYAVDYFNIRVWGFPLTLITFTLYGVFRGMQNTVWSMYIGLTGGLIHIALDLILVFGVQGVIDPMYIKGAAYASLTTQIMMLAVAFYFLYTKTPFRLKLSDKFHPELSRLINLSINLFLRTAALNFAFYIANRYATGYGKEQIAAHSIMVNIFLFTAFIIDGYGNAGNALSGKLLGSRDFKTLWLLGLDLGKICCIVAIIISALGAVLYIPIGKLFISEPQTLNVFFRTFWMLLIMMPINAVAFIFDGIYKGLGEATFLRNLLLSATFLGFIPTLWIGDHFHFQLYGIWIAFIVFMLVRALGSIWKFRTKYLTE